MIHGLFMLGDLFKMKTDIETGSSRETLR